MFLGAEAKLISAETTPNLTALKTGNQSQNPVLLQKTPMVSDPGREEKEVGRGGGGGGGGGGGELNRR